MLPLLWAATALLWLLNTGARLWTRDCLNFSVTFALSGDNKIRTKSQGIKTPGLDCQEALFFILTTSDGVSVIINLMGFNMTVADMNQTVAELSSRLQTAAHGGIEVIAQTPSSKSYCASTKSDFLASKTCGSSIMISSRLLGRRELVDISPAKLRNYLQQILTPATPGSGSMALFGLQGGHGTASTPEERQGSVHPAWRRAYAHFMTYCAPVNATVNAEIALRTGADWYEEHIEPVWKEWAGPDGGSYANEGNVFSSTWKEDFYGLVKNYKRLERIKRTQRRIRRARCLFGVAWGVIIGSMGCGMGCFVGFRGGRADREKSCYLGILLVTEVTTDMVPRYDAASDV